MEMSRRVLIRVGSIISGLRALRRTGSSVGREVAGDVVMILSSAFAISTLAGIGNDRSRARPFPR
jgi:hypothetical protein